MNKIAIVGTESKGMFGVSVKYMEWASQFGEVVVLAPEAEFDSSIDLLILQGGADINPETYGKKPFFHLGRSNPYFDYFDEYILPDYVKNGTPMFGICRGMQLINVIFNGTLKNIYCHETSPKDERDKLVHYITTNDEIFEVNSIHHQAVDEVGEDIKVLAVATDDSGEYYETEKIVEALAHKTLPICGVQYHPEEIYDDYAIDLVKKLLSNEDE